MGFIQSSKELYKLGIENLLTNEELDGFCENINASVQNVHQVCWHCSVDADYTIHGIISREQLGNGSDTKTDRKTQKNAPFANRPRH